MRTSGPSCELHGGLTFRRRRSSVCSSKRRTRAKRYRADPRARGLGARSGQEHPPACRAPSARVRNRLRTPGRSVRPCHLLDRQHEDRRRRETVRRRRAVPASRQVRDVDLVKQHPGKMWLLDGKTMRPLLDQSHLESAWHAGQYQALPQIYVQNSALEIAWTRVVSQTATREGRVVAPYLTKGYEGFNIDDEEDWERARRLLDTGDVSLPDVT